MSNVSPSPLFPPGTTLSRQDFPANFKFGAAGSAFQTEGALNEDGRGESIWDVFLEVRHPEVVAEGGLEAIRQYHKYEEDINVIKEMGLDSYRFSISWSRILPKGRRTHRMGSKKYDGVNARGVAYYNKLINDLIANGIEPLVTLFHWDTPLALEKEYRGFLDRKIVEDFWDYADVCFDLFGDRVKHWSTLNEPWSYCIGGYARGTMAPGRGATTERNRSEMKDFFPGARANPENPSSKLPTNGDPYTEPYIVGHNLLLAHAAAFKLYYEKYKRDQGGVIGIVLVTNWEVPYSDSEEDKAAARRALDFMFGWFMDPISKGDYPDSMKKLVGKRLPKFSAEESNYLKGSFDYLGINYYTANYVQDDPHSKADSKVKCTGERDGVPIGEQAGSTWLYAYPLGIYELLMYVKDIYHNPIVYITENGWDEVNNKDLSFWVSLFDLKRISYLHNHLSYIKKAIENGSKVKRYYIWSLMDSLEWESGFDYRFGINFIDYEENLQRFPKLSAVWYKLLLEKDLSVFIQPL